jgi:hypothetical protein
MDLVELGGGGALDLEVIVEATNIQVVSTTTTLAAH